VNSRNGCHDEGSANIANRPAVITILPARQQCWRNRYCL